MICLCLAQLCGCAAIYQKNADEMQKKATLDDYGVEPPSNYLEIEETILKERMGLIDPDSALIKERAKPYRCVFPKSFFSTTPVLGWCSFLQMNAKNQMGGYTGYKPYAFYWVDGKLYDYTGVLAANLATGNF